MEVNTFLFFYFLSFAEDLDLQKFGKLISTVFVLSYLKNGIATVLRVNK